MTTTSETDARFSRAEALLASSGRRLVPTPARTARPPRWLNPDGVSFREYRTEPETGVHVFVYAFPSEGAATSAEPEVRKHLLDGSRAQLVRAQSLLFWIEAPLGLPGRTSAFETNQTFDAIAAAVARP